MAAAGAQHFRLPPLGCIGQGKTATKSLNKALVMLGFQTAHFYGAGIYGLLYDNAAEDQRHEFLFNVNEKRHVDAVLDTPVVEFYNEILLAYPKARIILTIREPRSWLKSQQKFYFGYARGCRNWLAPWRRGSNLVYGTECPTRAQALKRYVQHNRNVFDNVPRDRLLVMDIPGGDGGEARPLPQQLLAAARADAVLQHDLPLEALILNLILSGGTRKWKRTDTRVMYDQTIDWRTPALPTAFGLQKRGRP